MAVGIKTFVTDLLPIHSTGHGDTSLYTYS